MTEKCVRIVPGRKFRCPIKLSVFYFQHLDASPSPPPPPLQFLRLRIWNVRYHEWRNGVLYGRVYIKHGYNMEKQISRNKRIYFFSFFFRVEKILRANILIARELNVFNRMKGMIRTSLMSLISCYNMYSIHCIWIHTSASNSTNIITLDRCK